MKNVVIFLIQFVSKLFIYMGLRACRFYPTCSEYSTKAYQEKSFGQASWLTLTRLCKCHPFSAGGYDPVN